MTRPPSDFRTRVEQAVKAFDEYTHHDYECESMWGTMASTPGKPVYGPCTCGHDDTRAALLALVEEAVKDASRLQTENAELHRQLDDWEANEPCPECGEVHVCGVQAQFALHRGDVLSLTHELEDWRRRALEAEGIVIAARTQHEDASR